MNIGANGEGVFQDCAMVRRVSGFKNGDRLYISEGQKKLLSNPVGARCDPHTCSPRDAAESPRSGTIRGILCLLPDIPCVNGGRFRRKAQRLASGAAFHALPENRIRQRTVLVSHDPIHQGRGYRRAKLIALKR